MIPDREFVWRVASELCKECCPFRIVLCTYVDRQIHFLKLNENIGSQAHHVVCWVVVHVCFDNSVEEASFRARRRWELKEISKDED